MFGQVGILPPPKNNGKRGVLIKSRRKYYESSTGMHPLDATAYRRLTSTSQGFVPRSAAGCVPRPSNGA